MGELLIAVALLWFLKLEKPIEWNRFGSSLLPFPLFPDRERHPPRHQELHSDHPHRPRDPVQRPSVSRNPCSSSTLLSCTRPCAAHVSSPLPHLDLTVSPTKVRSGGGFHYATRQPHDRGPNVMPWLGVHDQEGG